MPSNDFILCHPLLFLPSVFQSISVFSNESSALHIRWPKCWSFSFSISPSNEYWGLISFKIDWFDLIILFPLNSIGWVLLLLSFQRWGNRDTERSIFLSSVLAQTAITRYHISRVGASPTEIYYLIVLDAGGPRLNINMVGFWRELSSCLVHSCILSVSPHSREGERALVFYLFFSKV